MVQSHAAQDMRSCGDIKSFPWTIKVNGQAAHSLNANRIGALILKPGEVEHWTYINGGGGWDHPIHLHFEEGITIDRGGAFLPETERLVRKDAWRLRPNGRVKFQVRFGEFGGAYVNHCHNTIREEFAMLLRHQLLTPPPGDPDYKGQPHFVPTKTPIPLGVTWKDPEILPEADPRSPNYIPPSGGGSAGTTGCAPTRTRGDAVALSAVQRARSRRHGSAQARRQAEKDRNLVRRIRHYCRRSMIRYIKSEQSQ